MTSEQLRGRAEEIRRIAQAHGGKRVRVFGSFASGRAGAASDLDLLIDLEPGRSLLDLVAIKQELEAALGLSVDVVEEEGLSPYLRERILREAMVL
jgi:predicted nucleotidyltransferase